MTERMADDTFERHLADMERAGPRHEAFAARVRELQRERHLNTTPQAYGAVTPPTPEQIALVARCKPHASHFPSEETKRSYSDALSSVLAYARLGAETHRIADEAGMLYDRTKPVRPIVTATPAIGFVGHVLSEMDRLGLLAPPPEGGR